MQVALFDNRSFISEASRLSKQMETRKFELNATMASHVEPLEDLKDEVKEKIDKVLSSNTRYKKVGDCACDNYFFVEALGIGEHCKKYTIILDFSERLDYVLHRLSGCKTETIRKIPDYEKVSHDILNLNFNDLRDINFSAFINLDEKLDKYLIHLVCDAAEDEFDEEVIITNFISTFYNQILNELASIKDYCVVALKSGVDSPSDFVYRSKSFSSALISSNQRISDVLRITSPGYEDCYINVKCYEPYQYLKEEREAI